MGGCADPDVTVAPEVASDATPPPVLTEVRLPVLRIDAPFRWSGELQGLVTMAVELGLADLPGVVPRVVGDAEAPSLLLQPDAARRSAEARLSVSGAPEDLRFELELCLPTAGCDTWSANASRERPWPAVAALLEGAASTLGVPVSEATRAAWARPGSKDPYAELLTGRSAATLYGVLPWSPPEEGARDVVTRAVLVDPDQALAQWALARWEMASTADGGRAEAALQRAILARPTSPVLAADLATLYALTNRAEAAVLAWEELRARAEDDPRWITPHAAALAAAARPADAAAALARLPAEFAWTPTVAALRVSVAEARGGEGLDPLLERWQNTDARAPEPVRRRVDLRVRAGRYAEAIDLVPALRQRQPGVAVDSLETALLVALDRPLEAAERAPGEVAARLRARALRAADPGAPLTELPPDLAVLLAEGDAFLWRGDPAVSLDLASRAITAGPSRAEGWALRARALEALGRAYEASDAWGAAWDRDPALEGGPVAPGRVASTFRYVEAGELLEEDPASVRRAGAMGPEL